MADQLILRIPAHLDAVADQTPAVAWLLLNGQGQPIGPVGRGGLGDVPTGVSRLTVLVPGTEVTDAVVALPGRNTAKLLKLVPFALEEQLATDVDEMHFALGARQPDGRLAVAAIARRQLAAWLERLAAHALHPHAMLADTHLLPDNPAHVVVVLDGDRVIVRRPGGTPVTLDATPLDVALELARVFEPVTASPQGLALHLLIYATPADWETHHPAIERIRSRVSTLKAQMLPDGVLPLLASGGALSSGINLLQGEFAPRARPSDGFARYRVAAMFGGLFLVLHLGTLGVTRWQLYREEAKLDAELSAAATQALPDVHNVSRLPSVRLAVEARVHALRAAASTGVVGSFAAIAPAFAGSDASVQSASYQPGDMQLTLDAPNSGFLERLRQNGSARGFRVEIDATTPHEARVQGRIRVRESGT